MASSTWPVRTTSRRRDVERIEATIGVAQAAMLRNHAPVTGLEAKFSLEFAVACALVAGRVGLAELTDAFVAQPSIREAMSKLSIATTGSRCPLEPAFSFSDRVVLKLKDGRGLDSGEIRFARGNSQLPLRDDELRAKFVDCTSTVGYPDAASLLDRLMRLESLRDVRELAQAPDAMGSGLYFVAAEAKGPARAGQPAG